jgi:hypothetical protein
MQVGTTRSMVRALKEPEMSGAYGRVYRDGSGYSVPIVGSSSDGGGLSFVGRPFLGVVRR